MKRKLTRLFSVFISLGLSCSCAVQAAETTTDSQVKPIENVSVQLQRELDHLTQLRASYQQRVLDQKNVEIMQGSGVVMLKRPSMLRWQQTVPDETLLVSNGDKTYFFDTFAEQVTILNSKHLINSTPFALLTSDDPQLWQAYQVTISNGTYAIVPKQLGESQVERLELTFKNHLLSSMRVFDTTGQVSAYEFSEQQVDKPILDAEFSFVIPDGALVDDQSQGE